MVCEKTSSLNNDVMIETVKRIFSGGLKSHIPEELRIVSKFYENPKPELFSNQEISLTCLGKPSKIKNIKDRDFSLPR